MNDDLFKCEMCGKVLPAPDTICTSCDRELTHSKPVFNRNKSAIPMPYSGGSCPSCNNDIPWLEQVLYPENAPWYKPQRYLPRCPVCKTILCKKYETKAYRNINSVLLLIYLLFQFIPINQWTLLARYVFTAVATCYLAIILYRSYRDPVKYVVNE